MNQTNVDISPVFAPHNEKCTAEWFTVRENTNMPYTSRFTVIGFRLAASFIATS